MQVVTGTSAGKIGITNRIRQDMRNLQKEVKLLVYSYCCARIRSYRGSGSRSFPGQDSVTRAILRGNCTGWRPAAHGGTKLEIRTRVPGTKIDIKTTKAA